MRPTLAFIDFEASSLDPDSWPIEVGYATTCGRSASFLLQRQPEWSMEGWNRASAQIHGISIADLDEAGVAAGEALARLGDALKGAIVVSDAPAFDGHWLNRLAEAAGAPAPFEIQDWIAVLPSGQTSAERDVILAEARLSEPHRHRAEADARIMRAVWQASWDDAHAAWAEG